MSGRLTVLGSGVGVPGFESQQPIRYPPGYLLEKDGSKFLLEASLGIEFRLAHMRIDFSKIPTIIISHFHPDHFGGLINYLLFLRVKLSMKGQTPSEVTVVGPQTLKKRFDLVVKAYWEETQKPFKGSNIKLIEMEETKPLYMEKIKLTGFPVFHESKNTKALAYRFEHEDGLILAYSGDSGRCGGLLKAASKADIFICEASAGIGEDKSKYGHLNPYEAGQLASDSGVGKLWLTHYWYKDKKKDVLGEVKRGGFNGEVRLLKDFEQLSLQ
jgi:ribonuclease BN (tRNA processing enzyme)